MSYYKIEDFKLSLFPCRLSNNLVNVELYNSSYNLWKDTWLPTLKELDNIDQLYSDDFTRHDIFTVISFQNTAVALCCFQKINLKISTSIDDSWFKPWPKEFLIKLSKDSELAVIPSWLTVHEKFRRSAGFDLINLGEVMGQIISIYTINQNADLAFGTPRKDRSVDKLVEAAGATTIYSNVLHHGVPVNLVCFFSEQIKKIKFSEDSINLWKNRLDYTKQQKRRPNENNFQI